MYDSLIKEFDSGKCTKIVTTYQGFMTKYYYEVRIYITTPRGKVPSLEEVKKLAKLIMEATFKETATQGYTHKVSLKSHPKLKILLKKIDKPKKIEENETN